MLAFNSSTALPFFLSCTFATQITVDWLEDSRKDSNLTTAMGEFAILLTVFLIAESSISSDILEALL